MRRYENAIIDFTCGKHIVKNKLYLQYHKHYVKTNNCKIADTTFNKFSSHSCI